MTTVFDISADRAIFRKPYTTTSSQSYPFPPPSTVAGIISAILGFRNNSDQNSTNAHYWQQMKDTRIAIKLNHSVRWETHSLNYYNTKSGNRSIRTQIKHQFLKQPSFRIFVQGELEQPLSEALKAERFVFTPYLGVAYALADVLYIGRLVEERVKTCEVHTIIPCHTTLPEPDMKRNLSMNISEVPFEFTPDRSLKSLEKVIYKMDGSSVFLKRPSEDIQKIGTDHVMWFPYW